MFLYIIVHAVDAPVQPIISSPSRDDVLRHAPDAPPLAKTTPPLIGKKRDVFDFHPRKYDTALLHVINQMPTDITVWAQSDECYKVSIGEPISLSHSEISVTAG